MKLPKELIDHLEHEINIGNVDKKVQNLILLIFEENQKYKEVFDKLKDLIKNKHTNDKVFWFDKEYAKTYGELCTMSGSGETRTAVVTLTDLSNILKEVK